MKKFTAKVLGPVLALLIGSPALAAEGQAGRVDINTASRDQLQATLGVGEADAQRIIDARPYAKKEELRTKDVMSAEAFEKHQKLIDSVC